jgi:hypothetical protein
VASFDNDLSISILCLPGDPFRIRAVVDVANDITDDTEANAATNCQGNG